ncbi:glycerate kinase [Rothia halotolerans]|uniref:glycerate kinase family protein n=1 Tax=Rothia halotolerans TaxID=405770 RepID=UPI00101BDE18|nr:glycerate kinase [Rothia halotolerans]
MVSAFPRYILVAPSGFKESLDAHDVAHAISAGIRRAVPGALIKAIPIADGGEGTAKTMAAATNGHVVPASVIGPVGQQVSSHYALLGGDAEGTAVVEMAAAGGLALVPRDQRDPGATTTYGVGQLIAGAIESGVQQVLVGCGDSGTSDGGMGALKALGAAVLDAEGREVPEGGTHLKQVDRVDLSGLHPAIREGSVKITLALNPYNILTGPRGVARVFAPQKGASPEQVEELSRGFDHWARVLTRDRLPSAAGIDFSTGAGTGASGGLGAGLASVGAVLMPRFEALLDSGLAGIDLESLLAKADLVVTAEGAIDFQTPRGKVPAELARRAGEHGVPVIALAGTLGEGARGVYDIGIDAIASIVPIPMSLEDAVADGENLLREATERLMRTLMLGAALAETGLDRRGKW